MAAMADLAPDEDVDTQMKEAEAMIEETDHETRDTEAMTVHEGRCIQLLDLKTLALNAWAYCRYGARSGWESGVRNRNMGGRVG